MSRIIRNIDNITGGNFTAGISFDSQYSTNFLTSKSQNDFNIPDLSSYNVICFKGNTDIDLKGLESSNLTNWNGLLILNALNNDKRLKNKKKQSQFTS